jgi:hypothetical protein
MPLVATFTVSSIGVLVPRRLNVVVDCVALLRKDVRGIGLHRLPVTSLTTAAATTGTTATATATAATAAATAAAATAAAAARAGHCQACLSKLLFTLLSMA